MYLTKQEKERIALHDRTMAKLYSLNDDVKSSLIQLSNIKGKKEE